MFDAEKIRSRLSPLANITGWYKPGGWTSVRLTGFDAQEWLQGQVTQNVRSTDPRQYQNFFFCQSNGQIESAGYFLVDGDSLHLVLEPRGMECLERRLENYVIAEDVSSEPLLGDVSIGINVEGGISVADGRRFSLSADPEEPLPDAIYHSWRILRQICSSNEWKLGRTFPQELGPRTESLYVSYEKGCYLGQEVIHRIFAQGSVKRQWACYYHESEHALSELVEGTDPLGVRLTVQSHLEGIGCLMGAFHGVEAGFELEKAGWLDLRLLELGPS